MRQILIGIFILSFLGMLGCSKRIEVTKIEKERLDQNISAGNRGFFTGTPPPIDQSKERVRTRTTYEVRVELPPYPEWKKYKSEDKKMWGNRGYIYGGPQVITPPQVETEKPAPILLPEEKSELTDIPTEPAPQVKITHTIYIVQKGDTLGKIAKKVYGKSARWKEIYDANRDALKSPHKIYPGQKLKIPQD